MKSKLSIWKNTASGWISQFQNLPLAPNLQEAARLSGTPDFLKPCGLVDSYGCLSRAPCGQQSGLPCWSGVQTHPPLLSEGTQNFQFTPPAFLTRQRKDAVKEVLITKGIHNRIACKVVYVGRSVCWEEFIKCLISDRWGEAPP